MKAYETPICTPVALCAGDVIAASGDPTISYDNTGREYLVGTPSDWWEGNE